eukprot:gene15396-18260_t
MERYFAHLYWINQINPDRLVFLDEVHFNSKNLRKRVVLAPTNERANVKTDTSFSTNFSMSAMVRHSGALYLDKYLVSGDILILDNAAVHTGHMMFPTLVAVLQSCSIELRFLPAYSPELNPIELVFGSVKNFVRRQRSTKEYDLHILVFVAYSRVSVSSIQAYFERCVTPWSKDSDWVNYLFQHQQQQ